MKRLIYWSTPSKEGNIRFLYHRRAALAGLLVCLLCTPAAAQSQNLLTNGDFEAGDLTGWTVNDSPTVSQGVGVPPSQFDPPLAGVSYSIRPGSQAPDAGIHQQIWVTAGMLYQWSIDLAAWDNFWPTYSFPLGTFELRLDGLVVATVTYPDGSPHQDSFSGTFTPSGPTVDFRLVFNREYHSGTANPRWFADNAIFALSPPLAEIDIKPGSCPNSWNRQSNGVLPVAILGTEELDVTQIDVSSVTISRADGTGGSAAPNEGPPGPHSVFEDVGTPFEGQECDCHEAGADGILDLSMKFKTREVADLLPVDDPNGALVPLVVSGTLLDGTEFTSETDCVRLVPPGSPPGQVTVQSIAGAWVDATPLDNNLDGGGFGSFKRTYPHTTVLTLIAPSGHNGNSFVGWKLDGGDLVPDTTITLVVNKAEHIAEAVFNGSVPTLSPWSQLVLVVGLLGAGVGVRRLRGSRC